MRTVTLKIKGQRTIVRLVAIVLLLFSTMFCTFSIFVEAEIISKWYAFIGGNILCCVGSFCIIKKTKIGFDGIAIGVIIFICYLLVRTLWSSLEVNNIFVLSLITFILLYFHFRLFTLDYLRYIDLIIILSCFVQASFGIIQFLGIFHTYKVFKIVGSFDNPAGFAACLAVGFPFCFSVITKGGWKRCVGMISVVVIAASIILSGSRTGILAITLVTVIYLRNKYGYLIKKYRKYFFLLFLLLLLIPTGLFFLKKDSAVGRIFIWRNSYEMIQTKPVWGYGTGGFLNKYMKYQANYFQKNINSSYSVLSGNVTHPFCEYLLLTIEFGIIGLLMAFLILCVIIKSSQQFSIPRLCLLSVGICACFSYPLRYPFVVVLIAYSLANIQTKEILTISVHIFDQIVVFLLISAICIFWVKDIQFEKCWGELVEKVKFGYSEKILNNFERLYFQWNGDPLFLYNYGAVLCKYEYYEKSNTVLMRCTKYFNDYDIQMIIAENYYKLGQWREAEKYYITARNMIPNKFMPLYKLMLLYEVTNNKSSSLEVANIIINMTIKVPSGTVAYIKREAQKVIDNLNNTCNRNIEVIM